MPEIDPEGVSPLATAVVAEPRLGADARARSVHARNSRTGQLAADDNWLRQGPLSRSR
jgi:hypothetical protein